MSVTFDVREATASVSVVDIQGDVTPACEADLMAAYAKATGPSPKAIVLNFTGLDYMNSGGIGLLVTLLVRANRAKQRLMAYGLTDHYKQIFELTRLDEAITIHPDEQTAIAAV